MGKIKSCKPFFMYIVIFYVDLEQKGDVSQQDGEKYVSNAPWTIPTQTNGLIKHYIIFLFVGCVF